MMRAVFALTVLLSLNACATHFEPQPLSPDHPASADGPEAPRSGVKLLISSDSLTRMSKAQLARTGVPDPDFQSGGMSHDMGKMPGMEKGKPPAVAPPRSMPGMDASQMQNMTPVPDAAPANKEAVKMEMKKTSDEMKKTSDELKARSDGTAAENKSGHAPVEPVIYTCVMHPEVQLPAPGKCPKCGMTLVKKETASK